MKTAQDIQPLADLITADTLVEFQRQGYACAIECKQHVANVIMGKKFAKVDVNTSGKYMVELETGKIYGIKGYGVVHRGHQFGTLDTISDWSWGGYRATIKPKTAMVKDWIPVVSDLLDRLVTNGFALLKVDDGGEEDEMIDIPQTGHIQSRVKVALDAICSVDESQLLVKYIDGDLAWINIILGNEPFEIVADYHCNNPKLEEVLNSFADDWEGKECPELPA